MGIRYLGLGVLRHVFGVRYAVSVLVISKHQVKPPPPETCHSSLNAPNVRVVIVVELDLPPLTILLTAAPASFDRLHSQ